MSCGDGRGESRRQDGRLWTGDGRPVGGTRNPGEKERVHGVNSSRETHPLPDIRQRQISTTTRPCPHPGHEPAATILQETRPEHEPLFK